MRLLILFFLLLVVVLIFLLEAKSINVYHFLYSDFEPEQIRNSNNNKLTPKASHESENTMPEWIRDYIHFHRASINDTNLVADAQFLLYQCEGSCAGIGGRLKTMIKSLYASICSDRVLLIHAPSPFPLEKYLEPNLLQWNASSKLTTTHVHHVFRRGSNMSLPHAYPGIQLQMLQGTDMMDMNDVWNSDVCQSFFRRKNVSLVLQDEEALYRWGFLTLFRFSKAVYDRADVVKKQAGLSGSYVGLHLRTNKGENWNDPHRRFEGVESYLQCFQYFRDIYGLKAGYIAADNLQIKSNLQSLDKSLTFANELQIFHIDKSISRELEIKLSPTDSLATRHQKQVGTISNATIAEMGMLDLFAELLVIVDAECVIMSKSGLSYAMHYIPLAPRCGVFISHCTRESVEQKHHKYVQRQNRIINQV